MAARRDHEGEFREWYPRATMTSSRSICSGICLLAAFVQTASWAGQAPKPRPVPATPIVSPFSLSAPASDREDAVELRAPEAIDAQDREVIQSAWPVLAQKSSVLGFDLKQGQWSYRQIVCPVLSRHIALLFSNQDEKNPRRFSVVVPLSSSENVRVLPILRRGYSAFTPAPVSSATIAAFNAIRAHEPSRGQADWLATALCYAALAGAPIQNPRPDGSGDGLAAAMAPILDLGQRGTATVNLVQAGATRQPERWSLSFDPSGRLVNVKLTPMLRSRVTAVPRR